MRAVVGLALVACTIPRAPATNHTPTRERTTYVDHPLDAVVLAWRTRVDDYHDRIELTVIIDHRDYALDRVVGDSDDAASSAERCTSEPAKRDPRAAVFYCGGSYTSFLAELVDHEIVVTRADSYDAYHSGRRQAPEVVLRVPVRGTRLFVEPYGPESVTHEAGDDSSSDESAGDRDEP